MCSGWLPPQNVPVETRRGLSCMSSILRAHTATCWPSRKRATMSIGATQAPVRRDRLFPRVSGISGIQAPDREKAGISDRLRDLIATKQKCAATKTDDNAGETDHAAPNRGICTFHRLNCGYSGPKGGRQIRIPRAA